MGTRDMLPPDLLREMEESGVKFDENGEIIDPNQFLSDADEEDNSSEDENDDTDNSSDTDGDDGSDSDENDSEGDESDEEDDSEENDDKKTVKVTPRFKLTPRKQDNDSDDSEVAELRRKLAELEAKIKAPVQSDDEEDETALASTLRKEVSQFRKMRMKEFATTVEATIDTMYPETSFKEIISSNEWQEYQNSRVMGARVGDLYLTTIKSEDKDDVVSFFSDFVDRYLPSLSKAKPVAAAMKKTLKPQKDKPNLSDMAIPEKAKASTTKSKRVGFDFTTSDYQMMLEKAERGQITLEEFTKFEDKFLKADKAGRVKDE